MQADIELSLTEPLIWPLVPQKKSDAVATLWRLDARLMALALAGREPALRQIRLAWWRDALAAIDAPDARVPDEPLLRDVAAQLCPHLAGSMLADLAEARLAALGSDWATGDVMAAGEMLFGLTARIWEQRPGTAGGGAWALTSAALALAGETPAPGLLAAAAALPPQPAQPRPLAVLDRLARQIARRGGRRHRAREQGLILRVGLLGR